MHGQMQEYIKYRQESLESMIRPTLFEKEKILDLSFLKLPENIMANSVKSKADVAMLYQFILLIQDFEQTEAFWNNLIESEEKKSEESSKRLIFSC